METKKLISIRLDENIIDVFDQIASNNRAWSRSSIINEVLQYVIHAASYSDIVRMVRKWPKNEANFKDLIHES